MKKFDLKKFVIAGVLACCLGATARADIKYTTKTTMGEGARDNMTMGASSMTRYVKSGAERSETAIAMGKFKMNSITIHLCEPAQDFQLDPDLKIYTVIGAPKNAASGGASTAASTPGGAAKPKDEKTTGKVTITYAVKDLGDETIGDWKTHHYLASSHMEMSGCIGNGVTDGKVEYWVADVKDAYPCKDAAQMAAMPPMDINEKCRIETVTKGDVAAYGKIFGGLIVRQKIFNGDTVLMTLDVTNLSEAKLDDALFSVPADFKKVTPEEFQKAQSAAMMKAMMSGQMPVDGDDGDDNKMNDDKKDDQ